MTFFAIWGWEWKLTLPSLSHLHVYMRFERVVDRDCNGLGRGKGKRKEDKKLLGWRFVVWFSRFWPSIFEIWDWRLGKKYNKFWLAYCSITNMALTDHYFFCVVAIKICCHLAKQLMEQGKNFPIKDKFIHVFTLAVLIGNTWSETFLIFFAISFAI